MGECDLAGWGAAAGEALAEGLGAVSGYEAPD